MPFIFRPNSTLSATFSQGKSPSSWKIRIRSVPGPCTGLPSISTVPDVGCCSPAIKCKRVDLPQPEGPTMQRNSPALTYRLIRSSASRGDPLVLYSNVMSLSATLGVRASTAVCKFWVVDTSEVGHAARREDKWRWSAPVRRCGEILIARPFFPSRQEPDSGNSGRTSPTNQASGGQGSQRHTPNEPKSAWNFESDRMWLQNGRRLRP